MIFVDTNYFLRYFLRDIPEQYRVAKRLFEQGAGGEKSLFTSTLVLFEINWVLSASYDFNKARVAAVLDELLKNPFVHIAERDLLQAALLIWQDHTGLSYEDCYNVAYAQVRGAEEFKTFDKKLARVFQSLK